MGFLAKGNNIIINPSSGGSRSISYLYKYRLDPNEVEEGRTFGDAQWGQKIDDLLTPINVRGWLDVDSESSYKYCTLATVNQAYIGQEGKDLGREFNRNNRLDSSLKTSIVSNIGLDNLVLVSMLVKVPVSGDIAEAVNTAVHEYLADSFDSVIACSKMEFCTEDDRNITVDYNDNKLYECSMLLTRDYTIQEGDSLILTQVAILPNSDFVEQASVEFNVYRQTFIEFLGNNTVSPKTIGSNEINPNYKAVNSINNYIMEFDDNNIVEVDGVNVLVIPETYITEFKQPAVYFGLFSTSSSFSKISLGYLDMSGSVEEGEESQEQEPGQVGDVSSFVSTGTKYDVTISGTISNKVCHMVLINNEFTIKAIM